MPAVVVNGGGSKRMSEMRDRDEECFFTWDSWYRALQRARIDRARYLRDILLAAGSALKQRICRRAQRWHIRFCPLCCH